MWEIHGSVARNKMKGRHALGYKDLHDFNFTPQSTIAVP